MSRKMKKSEDGTSTYGGPCIEVGSIRITADRYQWILERRKRDERKSPDVLGYFTKLESLVLALFEMNMRRIPVKTLEELRDEAREFYKFVKFDLGPKLVDLNK